MLSIFKYIYYISVTSFIAQSNLIGGLVIGSLILFNLASLFFFGSWLVFDRPVGILNEINIFGGITVVTLFVIYFKQTKVQNSVLEEIKSLRVDEKKRLKLYSVVYIIATMLLYAFVMNKSIDILLIH